MWTKLAPKCLNPDCESPDVTSDEYWHKLYRFPVHTRCVGTLPAQTLARLERLVDEIRSKQQDNYI